PKFLEALGKKNGYQHLYLEAAATANSDNAQFPWMNNSEFYTLTMATEHDDEILLTRIGANDPDFNLRKEPCIILRRSNTKSTLFASVIEPHGRYSTVTESARNSSSSIVQLTVLQDDEKYTAVTIKTVKGSTRLFIVSNQDTGASVSHSVEINGQDHSWSGPYLYSSI
ncbi:MAG: hypothetical protein JKX81_10555, partial [Arenicella sp.]|nr:hypothetical protein [Arenicella sp.]